jgi:hypothetical protein
MTEVPKIVFDRLRSARKDRALPNTELSASEHPDADLLTAFVEQNLSAPERDNMLEHLALCGDCREVVTLTLPISDVVSTPIAAEADADRATPALAKPARSWFNFAWPHLGWAAVAAGIVVVGSLLLVHPGRLNQAALPSASRQVAIPAPSNSGAQIASPAVSSAASQPVAPPSDQLPILARSNKPRPNSGMQFSKKLKAGEIAVPHAEQPGMMLANNRKAPAQAPNAPATPPAGDVAFSASTPAGTTVEVSAAATVLVQESPAEGAVMAQNDAPPVLKSKPPLSVTWAITAGILQRSLDSGQNWQDALHPNHPLLCYATHGEEIWTGGQAGTLFYSTDGGLTWAHVQPSINARQLAADITHIDLRGNDLPGSSQVLVSTTDNETWSSTDNGKTWEKH